MGHNEGGGHKLWQQGVTILCNMATTFLGGELGNDAPPRGMDEGGGWTWGGGGGEGRRSICTVWVHPQTGWI